MDIVGTSFGIVIGALIAWYWGRDARKARAKGDRLLQHQAETIRELNGFLYAARGWATVETGKLNDRLLYIKDRDATFARIQKGEE